MMLHKFQDFFNNLSLVSIQYHFMKFFLEILGARSVVLQLTNFGISSLQDG